MKTALDIAKANEPAEIILIKSNLNALTPSDSNKIGFVFPVYVGILPQIVKKFLEGFQTTPETFYFSVTTYYTFRGVALSIVDTMLRVKGSQLSYGNSIATVGNCLMEYEVAIEKRPPKLKKADEKTALVAEEIRNNTRSKPFKTHRFGMFFLEKLFQLFFGSMQNKFVVEKNCINCGMCEKICPVKNISLVEGIPHWETHCEACHACVHWCPKNAIHVGKSKGRPQYHNPDITFEQLLPQLSQIKIEPNTLKNQ